MSPVNLPAVVNLPGCSVQPHAAPFLLVTGCTVSHACCKASASLSNTCKQKPQPKLQLSMATCTVLSANCVIEPMFLYAAATGNTGRPSLACALLTTRR